MKVSCVDLTTGMSLSKWFFVKASVGVNSGEDVVVSATGSGSGDRADGSECGCALFAASVRLAAGRGLRLHSHGVCR